MAIPQEVEWNIIKFMSHPCADILRPIIDDFDSYEFTHRTFDDYCFDRVLRKINTEDPSTWTDDYLEERYFDMINDCNDPVEVGCLAWPPARVLKRMDPVAYARGMQEYLEACQDDYNWG
jgi:hypothetical protein